MLLEPGSPEAAETTRLIGERLAAWGDRARSGEVSAVWQPRAPAPRGATRLAEHVALDLIEHRQVRLTAHETSPDGLRAIARAFALIAYDLRDDPDVHLMAANLHDIFAGYSHAMETQNPAFGNAGPESVLAIPEDPADEELHMAAPLFTDTIGFAAELTWSRVFRATPGEQQQAYVLVLRYLEHMGSAQYGLIAGSDAAEHTDPADWHRPTSPEQAIEMATAVLRADPNTPAATIISAATALVSIWVLVLDVLIGMAERRRFGPECDGYLFAAAIAMTQSVQSAAIAHVLTETAPPGGPVSG